MKYKVGDVLKDYDTEHLDIIKILAISGDKYFIELISDHLDYWINSDGYFSFEKKVNVEWLERHYQLVPAYGTELYKALNEG